MPPRLSPRFSMRSMPASVGFALLMSGLLGASAARGPQLKLLTERAELGAAVFKHTRQAPEAQLRVTLMPDAPRAAFEGLPGLWRQGVFETPVVEMRLFDRAVASWNVRTPAGTLIKLEIRARIAARWTRYYPIALWSADPAMPRRSFEQQVDSDGRVNTDTLELKHEANAWQMRVTFASRDEASPNLTLLAVVSSLAREQKTIVSTTSTRRVWGTSLPVPTHSQMLYPDGGEVWCSPTSMTMLLEYWGVKLKKPLADPVPLAARLVWDSAYDGAGNWPFNTAYVASKGLVAHISRLSSLVEAESYIERGIPLAMSIAWQPNELHGAHIERSSGHIVVLVGFDTQGNPIINDPAALSDAKVRTIYRRNEFERAWIGHSGGVVYVAVPDGRW